MISGVYWLIAIVTVNTVVSQLALKRALGPIGTAEAVGGFAGLFSIAIASPYLYLSLALQAAGYVLWMVILSREKLGIAVAISGAFFYLLVTSGAWLIYGERLSAVQWIGIGLITAGVICVGTHSS